MKEKIFDLILLCIIILCFSYSTYYLFYNNVYCPENISFYLKRVKEQLKDNNNPKYNYIFHKSVPSIYNHRSNIHFYLKKYLFFTNKKYLIKTLNNYYGNKYTKLTPETYLMPEQYDSYQKNCVEKKMILKTNTHRQEGLYVTNMIQPLNFIKKERFIVAQEYLSDCLKYKEHRISARVYLFVKCYNRKITFGTSEDGLIYYNNNNDQNISSFYGSYNLYDKGFPVGIKEFENKTNIYITESLLKTMSLLTKAIESELKKYLVDENINDNAIYCDLFGVDFHITPQLESYVLEINMGPGMKEHNKRDDKIRNEMSKSFLKFVHS